MSRSASNFLTSRPKLAASAGSLPQGYFEVERVLDSKVVAGEVVYLVRWRGHGEEHDSWEPRDNLSECLELVEDYDFANSERWLYEP